MRQLSTILTILLVFILFPNCDKTSKKAIQQPELAKECFLTPEPGPCKGAFNYFYYDQVEKKCTTFIYGGCQGVVPFKTLEACQKGCNCD